MSSFLDNKSTDSVLSLLAMTVFADKNVFAVEIFGFVKAAQFLQAKNVIKPDMSEADLLIWYEDHKEELFTRVIKHDVEIWLSECLNELNHVENKAAILTAMTDIATADDELHISEVALHVLAANKWNIDYDIPKIASGHGHTESDLVLI